MFTGCIQTLTGFICIHKRAKSNLDKMIKVFYIGGPSAIIEIGGLRFMTVPTPDPPGGIYASGTVSLWRVTPLVCKARRNRR
jgi:hypothetical protein